MSSVIDEIKARIDIADLVTESGVALRRSGRNYTGFCPFHDNKRTPSFAVWPETGTWYCFGECHEGGDIFKYVMKKEGMDFKEALDYLAQKAGVRLEDYRSQSPQKKESFERLYALLEDAVLYFHEQLLHSQEGAEALQYLREKRGLSAETIERFGLGYAPDAWDTMQRHFTARGYHAEDLLAVGLVRPRERGGYYDTFRHRLMIPIRDARGKMVGFGARALSADEAAKYINSPQTELFNKSGLLYGLDRARKAIRRAGEVIVVEGYMDVMGLHQAGYENAVAPMGTALTEEQFRLIKRYTRRIILALDPDEAGRKAILRGLESARQALDRKQEVSFDPRGLLRFEARFQADLRVVTLPDGLDPDELVAQDVQRWRDLLAQARPVVQYVMETLVAEQNVDDPRVKGEVARKVLPLIDDVVDPVEQASYRQRLARMLGLDESVLLTYHVPQTGARNQRAHPRPQPKAQGAGKAPRRAAAQPSREEKMEAFILSALYYRPSLYFELNKALLSADLSPLAEDDFMAFLNQRALLLLVEALEQIDLEPPKYVQLHADEMLMAYVQGWMSVRLDEKKTGQVFREMYRTVLQLRRQRLDAGIRHMRLMQDGEADADWLRMMSERLALLSRIDRALARAPFEKDENHGFTR